MSSKFEDEQKRRDPVEMKQMDIKDVNGEEFGCKEQKRLSNVKAGPSKLMLKLVELLAEKIEENSDDYLDERGIVSFLALIAKHADMENKIRIGETGVIKVITKLVDDKFMAGGWYAIIEVGWSFLFSIIDEAPINKTLFNEAGGKAINHKYLLHPQLGPRYFKNIRKNLANIQSNIFSDNNHTDSEEDNENNSHPVKFQKIDFSQFDVNIEDNVKMINLILKLLEANSSDFLTQRAVVSMLVFMTGKMEEEEKIKIGKIGIIEAIFKLIENKFNMEECDLVMRDGLLFLRRITDVRKKFFFFLDGIRENCEIFVKTSFEIIPRMIKKLDDPKFINIVTEEGNLEMLDELGLKMKENKNVEELTDIILSNINQWGKGIYEVNKEKPASDKKEVIKPVVNDEIKEIKEVKKLEPIFTTNPAELKGEIINVRLKNEKPLDIPFGITLSGMNGTRIQNEFIQIKRVFGRPEYLKRVLPGDIIVYINEECILGARSGDVCKILVSFSVGEIVNFQLCRGYAFQKTGIQLIRGKDYSGYFSFITGGSPAWCYLLVDKDKREALLQKRKTGNVDIKEYGEVLYSGLGKDPPKDIKDKMVEEYGINPDYKINQFPT
uniref:Protein zer-1 homolog-like C-terminal domain-containing protein n=1 Tax=Meloidogyne enterolobii TaxID=390850 RepID=A0A6V7UH59_MELEN|nr:unnamed protein product [Meloidogyne enterolobii]